MEASHDGCYNYLICRHNCEMTLPTWRKLDEVEEGRRGLGEALPDLVTAWSNMPHIPVGLGLQFIERYINVIDMNTLVQIHVCIFFYTYFA